MNLRLVLFVAMHCSLNVFSQPVFNLVSENVGIVDTSKSFGMYWGDIDNNDFPDLFLTNHYYNNFFWFTNPNFEPPPCLYLNNGDFSFQKIVPANFGVDDYHCASFFKTKENEFQNMMTFTGRIRHNVFYAEPFLNGFEPDTSCTLCASTGRSRSSLAFDYNLDGRTDMLVSNEYIDDPDFYWAVLYEQDENYNFQFLDTLELPWAKFSIQADVDNDGAMELVIARGGKYFFYDLGPEGLDLNYTGQWGISDLTVEDFDGDGLFEVLASKKIDRSKMLINENVLDLYLAFDAGFSEFVFTAGENFEYQVFIYPFSMIGYQGGNYNVHEIQGPQVASVSNSNFLNWPLDTLPENYVNLSYSDLLDQWKLQINRPLARTLRVRIKSDDGVQLMNLSNIDTAFIPAPLHLMHFEDAGDEIVLLDDSILTNVPIASIISEDFDNDGDIDFIFAQEDPLLKYPLFFIQNTSGQFEVIWQQVNLLGSDMGFSDVCSAFDLNLDGKMDVGTTNANRFAGEWGVTDIFENITINDNRWLKVKLQGVESNAEGLGSIITVYADDISQKRVFDGGNHKLAQDQALVHFGLGTNTIVDSVVVCWSLGRKSIISNVEVDQIIEIVEIPICEQGAYPEVTGLITEEEPDLFKLSWNPINGSIGCQIDGGLAGGIDTSTSFDQIEMSSHNIFKSNLVSGNTYQWKVKCGCQIDPLIMGPWSDYEYFIYDTTLSNIAVSKPDDQIEIYPNPTKDNINITGASGYQLSVYNLYGQPIFDRDIDSNEYYLILNQLKSGMYILRFDSDYGYFITKIVKD